MASPQGLSGLTGLTPTVTPTAVSDPGATAAEIHGTTVNPVHADWEWDNPVPWAIQQGIQMTGQPIPNPDPTMLGSSPHVMGAGYDTEAYADANLTHSHNAPYPEIYGPVGEASNREAAAEQQQINQAVHASDTGAAREFTMIEIPTDHKMPWGLSPDYNTQGAEEGTQVGQLTGNNRTGWDRFAGWAQGGDVTRATAPGTPYPAVGSAGGNLNRFGFDQAHIQRQNPMGDVPVPRADTTVQGIQRPMVMNVPGRYGSYPVGAGSPFQPQTQPPGVGNNIGAAEIGVPSDYSPPPDAPTNAPLTGSDPVWGYSFLG
jgi:hypothetical protein